MENKLSLIRQCRGARARLGITHLVFELIRYAHSNCGPPNNVIITSPFTGAHPSSLVYSPAGLDERPQRG